MGVAFIAGMQGDDPRYAKTSPPRSTSPFTAGPRPSATASTRARARTISPTHTCRSSRPPCARGGRLGDGRVQPGRRRAVRGQPDAAVGDAARRVGVPRVRRRRLRRGRATCSQPPRRGRRAAAAAAAALRAGTESRLRPRLLGAGRGARAGASSPRRDLDARWCGSSARASGWACSIRPSGRRGRRSGRGDRVARAPGARARGGGAQSIVLLENRGGVLPLGRGVRRLAVVGPDGRRSARAARPTTTARPSHPVTVLDGIRAAAPRPRRGGPYARGAALASERRFDRAARAGRWRRRRQRRRHGGRRARSTPRRRGGREARLNPAGDRARLELPAAERLLEAVAGTGKPVVRHHLRL